MTDQFADTARLAPARLVSLHADIVEAAPRVLEGGAERRATADQLIAMTIPTLVSLHTFAVSADVMPEPDELVRDAVHEFTAMPLRLVDLALRAHAEAKSYQADGWITLGAKHAAHLASECARRPEGARRHLVEAAAYEISTGLTVIWTDWPELPGILAQAMSVLLVLHLSVGPSTTGAGRPDVGFS